MTTHSNGKLRILEYDTLRVIVTLLVIIGHCTYYVISTPYGGCDYSLFISPKLSMFWQVAEAFTAFIYLFHMPLYMALSGALYKLKNSNGAYSSYKSLITDKAKKLLLPFIVVTLLYSVPLKYISGYYVESGNTIKDIVVGQVLVQGNTHLWFLPALFLIFIIIFSLEKIMKKLSIWWIALCFFVISFASGIIHIGIICNALHYTFWFYIGYLFEDHREKVNTVLSKKPVIFFGLAIILLITGLLKKVISDISDTSEIFIILERLIGDICAVFGCGFVYSLSYFLSKTNIIEWRLFKTIRANTLGLYLYSDSWNYVILSVSTGLFGNAVFVTNIGSVSMYISRIVITFSIALAVSILLKKLKFKYIC